MLLTTPTIAELQSLELPSLMDMLAQQTAFYTKHIKDFGFTHSSESQRQLIVDIQAAIKLKESNTGQATRFPRFNTRTKPHS